MIQLLIILLPWTSDAVHTINDMCDTTSLRDKPSGRSESVNSEGLASESHVASLQKANEFNATRESVEERDYSFSYPPYAMSVPIFVSLQQRQMWEKGEHNGGAQWLELNATCAKFLPAQDLLDKIVVCNKEDPKGVWNDHILIRTDSILPADCKKFGNFQSSSEDPGPDATADISPGGGGDPSWSIQGFLGDGGAAMNIAQNIEVFNKYKSKVMIETRTETTRYNNSLTVSILKKAGFGSDRIVKRCGADSGCVQSSKQTLSLGCSRSTYHPQSAQKFRNLMGVKARNPNSQGTVVLFSRNGQGSASAFNGGRQFTNYADVMTAMQSICTKYGLKLVVQEHPITDVDTLTHFLEDTVLAVGPHGGALYNLWFLPSGSGLIEITGEGGRDQGSSWFYHPAGITDVVYAPLYAKGVTDKRPGEGLGGHDPADFRNNDIEVNTTELVHLMNTVIDAVAKDASWARQ